MRYQSVARTDVGLRRKANEDAVLDRAEAGLWAVADGMGGADAGEVASAMIVETLQALAASDLPGATADAASETLSQVNAEIYALSRSSPTPRTIGSTVVALAIAGGRYDCCWAGDSRAYLLRERQLTRLTTDHSLVQDLIRAGMLEPERAESHPDSNVITRAVGVSRELDLDRVSGESVSGDIFLLASDGLTRVVPDGELAKVLATHNPMQAADLLIDTVLQRGAPDNVSLVIVRVA